MSKVYLINRSKCLFNKGKISYKIQSTEKFNNVLYCLFNGLQQQLLLKKYLLRHTKSIAMCFHNNFYIGAVAATHGYGAGNLLLL